MKVFLTLLLFGLVCATVTVVSVAMFLKNDTRPLATASKVEKPQFKPTAAQLDSVEVVNGDARTIKREIFRKTKGLLFSENFDGLDAMADGLRASKAHLADGVWHLCLFYSIICDLPRRTSVEADWKARLELLKRWINAKPNSITARVALAQFYIGYAWDARGCGYADTVSDEGWKLFHERIRQSKQVLMNATRLSQKCPMWWDNMQTVALAEGWELAEYDEVFNAAIAHEPGNIGSYNNKAHYLLPRWHGKEEGEWQRFATDACNKLGGETGDIMYARIGWAAHESGIYDDFLKDSKYSWPRMKKGMEDIIRQYPNSLSAPSELACLATQAKDRECARLMFERIGSKVDYSVWEDDKARFLRARTWAFSK